MKSHNVFEFRIIKFIFLRILRVLSESTALFQRARAIKKANNLMFIVNFRLFAIIRDQMRISDELDSLLYIWFQKCYGRI